MTNIATNVSPNVAPTRPALRADVAGGPSGGTTWACPAARLATTGGSDGRVRFGSGVPPADEPNEANEGRGAGAGTAEKAAGGVPGDAGGDEDERGIAGTEGDPSSPRRRTPGPGRVAGTIKAAALFSDRVVPDSDGSGARGGGKGAGGALGFPILRRTSRRAR